MTWTVPVIDDHLAAVEATLATTGIPVARGDKPAGAGWQGVPGTSSFVPYMVLDAIPGGVTSGSAGDPQADVSVPFDVRCIGASATQAEKVADRARRVLCESRDAVVVPGRALLLPVSLEMASPARADMSMGDGQTLFVSSPRFRLHTTPLREVS